MKNKQGGFSTAIAILFIAVLILGFIGWVLNIIKLTKTDFQAPYKAEVIRAVSIIPPMGAIVGWINIKD